MKRYVTLTAVPGAAAVRGKKSTNESEDVLLMNTKV